MFETTFRNLDDTLRKDAGCSSELDLTDKAFDRETIFFLYYSLVAK